MALGVEDAAEWMGLMGSGPYGACGPATPGVAVEARWALWWEGAIDILVALLRADLTDGLVEVH